MKKEEPSQTPISTTASRWLGLGLLFVLGAVVVTWPLATQVTSGIPLGTEAVATVPLFNLWTLAWNVESLGRGYEGYWRAPIFHPAPDTLALSEPQPLAGLIAAEPGVRNGLFLGLALATAYALSAQVAVFGALAAGPALLWLWWPRRRCFWRGEIPPGAGWRPPGRGSWRRVSCSRWVPTWRWGSFRS